LVPGKIRATVLIKVPIILSAVSFGVGIYLAALMPNVIVKIICLTAILFTFVCLAWRYILNNMEKDQILLSLHIVSKNNN